MKNRVRPSTPTLFLTELVFAILFFAIASAVCVQLFARSHVMSAEARELSLAVDTLSSAAEIVSVCGSMEEMALLLEEEYPGMSIESSKNSLTGEITLNKDVYLTSGSPCTLKINAFIEGTMLNSELKICTSDGAEIYSQTVLHHLKRGN